MSLLLEMFTYPFILRAFAVGILVSLCAALLGVPLVLKRYSMIGDGWIHPQVAYRPGRFLQEYTG